MKALNYFCLFLVMLFWQGSSASRIRLEATPRNIYQSLTKTLQLRCAAERSNAATQRQISSISAAPPRFKWPWEDTSPNRVDLQRQAIQTSTQNWQWQTTPNWQYQTTPNWQWQTTPNWEWLATITTTPKPATTGVPPWMQTTIRSTPATAQEISHITSIIVTRRDPISGAEQKVATLSPFDFPTADTDFDKIQVTGHANSSPVQGELGYIELTWEYPASTQAGLYTCQVNALDTSLEPMSLSQTLLITSLEPTISDLISIVSHNDKTINELQQTVANLTKQLSGLNFDQDKVYDNIMYNISEIIQEYTGNMKAQNIQTGFVTCTNDYVYFLNPYKHIPTVFVAVNNIQYQGPTGSMIVAVQNLSENGFLPHCDISGLVSSSFVWIAIDN
jgi:hypothetical protein